MARKNKASVRPDTGSDKSVWRGVTWLALAGAWAFVLLSLIAFDRADPPSHTVWPANDPVRNFCGPVGAIVAYHLLKLIGLGVWVMLGLWAAGLWVTARGRAISVPVLRVVGVAMLLGACCGLINLIFPNAGPLPQLSGGTIGTVVAGELTTYFFGFAALALLVAGAIGAVVAYDELLTIIPHWIAEKLAPAARRAGGAASTTAAQATTKTSGSLFGALASMLTRRKPLLVRVNDLDDAVEVPANAVTRPDRTDAPAPVVEVKPASRAEPVEGPNPRPAPGAPQVFDPEALKEKIAKLPVRFSRSDKKTATEDDLRDLQNVGELEGYRFPGLDLLEDPEQNFTAKLEELVRGQAEALEASLQQYRIKGEVVGIETGPVITLYHVRLAPGTRVSALQQVSSDIARALKAINIRIVPNQVGRDTVGVEVPNPTKEKVRLKELMGDPEKFRDMKLPMFLGKDASGEPLIADLTEMPHMLIAGTTGSGKSVCMNTIIMGFLYTRKPNELKMVLVDPKMVEMSQFKDIPHLMCPVVTEMAKAVQILEWATRKMEERYELLAEASVRDIAGYNALDWEEIKHRFGVETDEQAARIPRRMPYMVFIIDELADMMMTNKEVETSIVRLAQKARAVGIHLILATQRPQANVVTGLIKSNMPCRITFKVASGMDSRIVLDQKGGELLLGRGDMLYLSPTSHKVNRAQGTLVDDAEIRRVVGFMRDIATPTFERQLMAIRTGEAMTDQDRLYESDNNSSASLKAAQEDPLFDRAVEIVLESKRGSVSLLQRRLAIGYTRASRLIDLMGIAGIISEHKGSVARDVMISEEEWAAMKALAEQQETSNIAEGDLDTDDMQQELFDQAEDQLADTAVNVHANPDDSEHAVGAIKAAIETEAETEGLEDEADPIAEDAAKEDEEEVEYEYVDEDGKPIDESDVADDDEVEYEYVDEDGNPVDKDGNPLDDEEESEYEYVDEDGNPIDESEIDEDTEIEYVDEDGNPVEKPKDELQTSQKG